MANKCDLNFKLGAFGNINTTNINISNGDICFGQYPSSTYGTLAVKSPSENKFFFLRPGPGELNLPLIGQGMGSAPEYGILPIAGGGTGLTLFESNRLYYYDSDAQGLIPSGNGIYDTQLYVNILNPKLITDNTYQFIVNGMTFFNGDISTIGKTFLNTEDPSSLNLHFDKIDDETIKDYINNECGFFVNTPSFFNNFVVIGSGLVILDQAEFAEGVYIDETLTVNNTTSLDGNLIVATGKTTSLGGALTVAEGQATSLGGTLQVTDTASFDGAVNIENTLIVGGLSTFNNIQVNLESNFTGNITTEGKLYVAIKDLGDATNDYLADLIAELQIGDWIDTFINNCKLFVEGDSAFNGRVIIGNELHAFHVSDFYNDVNILGETTLANNLTVEEGKTTSLGGSLTVTGSTLFNGEVAMENTLTTGGFATFNGGVAISRTGNSVVNPSLQVAGVSLLDGYTRVKGVLLAQSNLTVQGVANLQKTLNVTGVATMKGDLIAKNSVSMEKTLTVAGEATFNANASVEGTFIANTITVSGQHEPDINAGHLMFSRTDGPNYIQLNLLDAATNSANFAFSMTVDDGNGNYDQYIPLVINPYQILPGQVITGERYDEAILTYDLGSMECPWGGFYTDYVDGYQFTFGYPDFDNGYERTSYIEYSGGQILNLLNIDTHIYNGDIKLFGATDSGIEINVLKESNTWSQCELLISEGDYYSGLYASGLSINGSNGVFECSDWYIDLLDQNSSYIFSASESEVFIKPQLVLQDKIIFDEEGNYDQCYGTEFPEDAVQGQIFFKII